MRSGCWQLSALLVSAMVLLSTIAVGADRSLDASRIGNDPQSLTEYFATLEDPGTNLSLADVQTAEIASRFKMDHPPGAALNYGFTRSAHWLRLTVRNESQYPIERLLEIASPRHASAQFYQTERGQLLKMVDAGYLKPFLERPYKNRFFVFPLTIPANSEQVLYLRFHSAPSAMEIPARLWAPSAFHTYERADYVSQALYFGMLMAMTGFNLLLFIALRDVSYLLYVLFATATAFAMAANNGIAVEYLWNNTPRWTPIATMVTFSVSLGFLLLFMRRMLATQAALPRLDALIKLFLYLHLAILPIALAFSPVIFVKLSLFMCGITGLLILVTGFASLYHRLPGAVYFGVAYFFLCLGGVLTVMRGFGVVPTNTITTNGMQIGSALEMLLLAFALADRFNRLRREKAKAQRESIRAKQSLVEALQMSEKELEQRVTHRTSALLETNEALSGAYKSVELLRQEAEAARKELATELATSTKLRNELGEALAIANSANHEKSQFLANMSHEIRTPMNAVLGMLTLLRKTRLDPVQSDYAAKTEIAARSLLGLLNDVLDLSKVEAGKMELDRQPFRLDHLLDDLSSIVRASVGDKPIAIAFHVAPLLPELLIGDALRLKQILLNLCINAIKFTERGEVQISVTSIAQGATDTTLRFSVRDTGVGISAESQQRIFGAFAQADESTTRLFGGTGLGLSISQRLVNLMGGEIKLESSPGLGSTFHFEVRFPVVDRASIPLHDPILMQTRSPYAAHETRRRLEGFRILLVEDNLANQQVVKELLELDGAIIEIAGNGQQGVDIFTGAKPRFDVVLMDIQMPIMDGYTAAQKIRDQLPAGEALPIIAMTASAMNSDREASRAAGMIDFVSKPVDFNQLIEKILLHSGRITTSSHPDAQQVIQTPEAILADVDSTVVSTYHGIDVSSALLRINRNRRLYGDVLRLLIAKLPTVTPTLRQHFHGTAMADAGNLLHTLKGEVAMVGADGLARQLADYESWFEQDMSPTAFEALLAELEELLAHTCTSMQRVVKDFPEAPST